MTVKLRQDKIDKIRADWELTEISERPLAKKYKISRTVLRKLCEDIPKKNNDQRKNQEKKPLSKKQLLIEQGVEIKKNQFDYQLKKNEILSNHEMQIVEQEVSKEAKIYEFTTNAVLATQKLSNIATQELQTQLKSNPGNAVDSLNDIVKLNIIATKTHATLHNKPLVEIQNSNQQQNNYVEESCSLYAEAIKK